MIRNADLVSYLPPFMQEFKETTAALEAENPEFNIAWDSANRVLQNEFIATADEYGIARFEKILHILPSKEDDLESRRARVQARWFNVIPYTVKALISKLISLSGETNFWVSVSPDYKLELETYLGRYGQVEELERIIQTMIPCNMVVKSINKLICNAAGKIFMCGGVTHVRNFFITNDEVIYPNITGEALIHSGAAYTTDNFITNDNEESVAISGAALHGAGTVNTVSVTITNDFNEMFSTSGENSVKATPVITQFAEIKN